MYEQNKAQKTESKSNNSNYIQQFQQEKKNLTKQQRKELHALKKQFSLLKEPVILNVMKKHEFNTNIVQPELKMMQKNQQFSQSQNWIGDQQHKNQNNHNKKQVKKNYPQNQYENKYQSTGNQNYNHQQHQKKQYNNFNKEYQTQRYNKNYKNTNGNHYQKNYHQNYPKNYHQNKYQGGQQIQNQKYQQNYKQNGQYKQRVHHNNYNKQQNNNYQKQNYNTQRNGYYKKKYEFEYVKQNEVEDKDNIQEQQNQVQAQNQVQVQNQEFERISEQIDESNTYSEEHTSDVQESKKIHNVIQRLDTILTDKIKQSYKHLQVFAKELDTEQSQLKKNFDKKKYIKKGIDIKKEFIIEPDESSSHFVQHKVNLILQNKRFESEEEKFKSVREKQLETQIGEMKEDMKLMKRQIESLRGQVEELKRQNRSKKSNGKIDYCIVPVDIAEKYFNLKDKKKNFSLFGLSQEDEEDEDDHMENQLNFFQDYKKTNEQKNFNSQQYVLKGRYE